MNVSRFFGATNREAMRQVRLALGPDALIVSNRRVNGGVEIMATDQTSMEDTVAANAVSAASGQSVPPARPGSSARPSAPPVASPPAGVSPADLMQALGSMRGLLENGFDELMWGAQLRKAPQTVSLFQRLLALGFSTALLRAMLKRMPEGSSPRAALQWCRDELAAHLPVMNDESALWTPGVVLALVGPTGVGKTTTIAKLAARCVRRFGASNLVLVTTDTYRIGAHEQLKIYGSKLGVPVYVAQDRFELARLVMAAAPDARILIDNVGVSQRDQHIKEQAAMLSGLPRPVQRLLVLNAASQGDTLDEVARVYTQDGGVRPTGCIITKLDESARIGPALDIAIRYQLPIHFASTGQKVPQDLVYMDAEAWVEQALLPAQPASTLFTPSTADLAALMEGAPEPVVQRSADQAGNGSMLPGLLAVAGMHAATFDKDALRSACAELDASEVYSGAYQQWRKVFSRQEQAKAWRPLAAARNEMALLGQEHLLALHDAVGLSGSKVVQKIHSTVLLGGSGRALTTPWQQWSVGAGWQDSEGDSGSKGLSAADGLQRQIGFLDQPAGASAMVHIFNYPGQGLLRDLGQQATSWLAQCAGATRVEVQSCATTMAAHAKTLDYRCLDSVLSRLDLSVLQGVPVRDVALWAAEGPVDLTMRGSDALPLRQVSVRLIDRRQGKMLKSLHGLSNLPSGQVGLETLAAWLVVQLEVKAASRYLPGLWTLLKESASAASGRERVAASVQMALAVWRAQHAGQLLTPVLSAFAGPAGLRTAASRAEAMFRLFAMKDLLERQSGLIQQ